VTEIYFIVYLSITSKEMK